mmetsp:Transcript_73475/g.175113  ORF Transcript_73475/g.175113 Transcript_73475/m.175113 type:complete len:118 (+) Transcript_73475:725-1078(+)
MLTMDRLGDIIGILLSEQVHWLPKVRIHHIAADMDDICRSHVPFIGQIAALQEPRKHGPDAARTDRNQISVQSVVSASLTATGRHHSRLWNPATETHDRFTASPQATFLARKALPGF